MEQSIGQARAHLRQACEMLAEPWTNGPDSFQASLAQAAEYLRKAVREGPGPNRGEVAAGVQQLKRELAGLSALLEAASQISSGWSQIADLFAGVYGRDAEAIPIAPAPRVSIQV